MFRILLIVFVLLFFLPLLSEEVDADKLNSDNAKRISEIEERLDSVEKKTLVDRVNLSMDVRMTLNNYIYSDRSAESLKHYGLLRGDGATYGLWNMRGRLKLHAELGENFVLTAWMSMYKQFIESAPGRYDNKGTTPTYDGSRGYYPGNSGVYMERLYIDWYMTQWLSLSIGRISVTDGSPSDIRYNTVRLGTFPESMVNSPTDAIFFTLNLAKLINLPNSYLRLWYIPTAWLNNTIPNNLFVGFNSHLENTFGLFYEMEMPGLKDTVLYANAFFMPELKPPQAITDVNGDGINEVMSSGETLGQVYNIYLALMSGKPWGIPFDFFFSAYYQLTVAPVRKADDINNGYIGMPVDEETGISRPLMSLFGNSLDGEAAHGWEVFLLAQWETPIKMFDGNLKIGADVTLSNKYFSMLFVNDTTGLSLFNLRGQSAEAYMLIPVHRKANIRLGYIFQNHEHPTDLTFKTGTGMPSISEQIHNFSVMLNVYF